MLVLRARHQRGLARRLLHVYDKELEYCKQHHNNYYYQSNVLALGTTLYQQCIIKDTTRTVHLTTKINDKQ